MITVRYDLLFDFRTRKLCPIFSRQKLTKESGNSMIGELDRTDKRIFFSPLFTEFSQRTLSPRDALEFMMASVVTDHADWTQNNKPITDPFIPLSFCRRSMSWKLGLLKVTSSNFRTIGLYI